MVLWNNETFEFAYKTCPVLFYSFSHPCLDEIRGVIWNIKNSWKMTTQTDLRVTKNHVVRNCHSLSSIMRLLLKFNVQLPFCRRPFRNVQLPDKNRLHWVVALRRHPFGSLIWMCCVTNAKYDCWSFMLLQNSRMTLGLLTWAINWIVTMKLSK